jgi:Phage-related minor tail protein
MAETTALINLVGADRGLTKVLQAASAAADSFGGNVTGAADSLNDWNQGLSSTESALMSATKATVNSGRSIFAWGDQAGKGYNKFLDGAEKTVEVSDFLDQGFVKLGARMLGMSAPLNSVSDRLAPMAGLFGEVADQQTAAGKAAIILDAAEKPLVAGLKIAATMADGFATQLERMGVLGEAAAEKLHLLSGGLRGAAKAVGMADTAGDILLAAQSAKQFAEDAGPALIQSAQMAGVALEKSGFIAKITAGNYESLVLASEIYQKASSALSVVGKMTGMESLTKLQENFAGSLSKSILKVNEFVVVGKQIAIFTAFAADAYMRMSGLNEAFDAFEAMGVDSRFAKLGLSMGVVGEGLLLNKEAAKEFMNAAIGAYSKLEDSLAYVRTLGSGAKSSVEDLRGAMQKLVDGPLRNSITSAEAASALYNTMSAGFSSLSQSTQVMEAGLKLAAGSGADASVTMETLIKTMSAYGVSARDAGKTAAQLNNIVENGIVSFPQLAGGLSRVAGVAKATGVSFEEMSGSISALTYAMTADDAMTGYASLLQSIAGQGAQSEKAIADLGIKFDVNTIKTKGLVNSLKELYSATGGSTEKLKEIIPDALAFQTALSLMTSGSQKAAEFAKSTAETTAESLDEMFGRRQESMIKRSSALMNGFQEVLVNFGSRLAPVMEPGVKFLEGVLKGLQNLPEPLKAMIGGLLIAKVGMDNFVGVGTQFIGMIGQMAVASLMARGVHLAMTGQLFNEVAALKQLFLVQGDYGKGLLRLFGVEEMVSKISEKRAAQSAAQAAADAARNAVSQAGTAARTADVVIENAATGAVLGHTTATVSDVTAQQARSLSLKQGIANVLAKSVADMEASATTKANSASLWQNTLAATANAKSGLVGFLQQIPKAMQGAWVATQAHTASLWQNTIAATTNAKTGFLDGLKNAPKTLGAAILATKVHTVALFENTIASARNLVAQVASSNIWKLANGNILVAGRALIINTGAAIGNTISTLANTGATEGNTAVKGLAAAAQGVMSVAQTGGSIAMSIFTGVTTVATGALAAFNAMLGPVGIALIAIGAAIGIVFGILQDFIPALGGAASENEKLAQELDKSAESYRMMGDSAEEAGKKTEEGGKKSREYTGFLNTMVIPTLQRVADFNPLVILMKSWGAGIDAIFGTKLGEKFNGFADSVKGVIQDVIDKPLRESMYKAFDMIDEVKLKTREKTSQSKKGIFISQSAKDVVSAANKEARPLTGEELTKAMKADNEVLTSTKERNDALVTDYKKQMDQIKDPEMKKALQGKVDALNAETTALENAVKKQQEYIQNLNSMAGQIEKNNAGRTEKTVGDSLNKKMLATTKGMKADMAGMVGEVFTEIDTQSNKTSTKQRKTTVELGNAAADFYDNVKNAANINSQEGLAKLQQDADAYLEKIEKSVDSGQITEQLANKLRQDLVDQQIEIPELNMKGSVLTGDQQDTITKAQMEGSKKAADQRINVEQTALSRISLMEAEHQIGQQEAQKKTLEKEIEIADIRVASEDAALKKIRDYYGENSQAYKDQLQVANKANMDARQKRAALADLEFQQEQDRQKRILELEQNRIKQGIQAQLNAIELKKAALDQEQKLEQSRFGVVQAIGQYEEARIQNQIRLTNDPEKQAALELELLQKKQDNLAKTQEQEQRSLEIQIRQNEMAAQQAVLQNQIAQAENQRAIAETQLEVAKATREKRSAEEIQLIRQQIGSLEQQKEMLGKQGQQLEVNKKQQSEINANSREELRIKQQTAKETGAVDMQLAKAKQVSAQYEKQKVLADLAAKAATAVESVRLQRSEAISKSYERQTAILNTQKEYLNAQMSAMDTYFSVAADGLTSESAKKKLAEDQAKIKLVALTKQQAIERQIFEIQQLQNKAALEREIIQNRIQQAQAKAEIASAQAALGKAKANPASTPEEIKAAELGLSASLEKGAATSFAGEMLDQQRGTLDSMSQLQRQVMNMGQESALFKGRYDAASAGDKKQMSSMVRQQIQDQSQAYQGVGTFNPAQAPTVNLQLANFPGVASTADAVGETFDKARERFLARLGQQAVNPAQASAAPGQGSLSPAAAGGAVAGQSPAAIAASGGTLETISAHVAAIASVVSGRQPPVPQVGGPTSNAPPPVNDRGTGQKPSEIAELLSKIVIQQTNEFKNYFGGGSDAASGKVKTDVEGQLVEALKSLLIETDRKLKGG